MRHTRTASLAIALLLGATASHSAAAQGGVLLQGIVDAEFWRTDSGSVLLTRNSGRPGVLGRLQLWSAAEPLPGLIFYAQGQVERGRARQESGTTAELEQLGVRYVRSEAFALDIGKMTPVVGTFAARRLSTRNALIGVPDGYPVQYPIGVKLSGTRQRIDYRFAMTSLPVSHEGYTPDPSAAPRPAIGLGFTPFTGLRVGASATLGSYLNCDLPSSLLDGRSWRSFHQRVGAADVQFSRGYLEMWGEVGVGRYDVPGHANRVSGLTYYTEAKYTLSPRFFVASRFERNDYPFIQPRDASTWMATATNFYNGEIGAGFRVSAATLVKASYRADRWLVPETLRAILPNGSAFAVQVSRAFDVMELATPRR
jgi:hypothetical protein